jgi:preprotein translocase subunit SecA
VHLRAYAQRKPIDEYKHEAFAMFERMLTVIREDVTSALAHAQFRMEPPPLPEMPEIFTQHIDPFSGDDDTYDMDAGTGAILSRLPPLQSPRPELPDTMAEGDVLPVSRNALCPCGSGKKYKHCHGALA